MYILEPPPGWAEFRKSPRPPQKVDTNGDLMFEKHQKPGKTREPLLDFKILPDIIGTQEPWWYFEAIRRIDPRVRWCDITMRMSLEDRPSNNSLNQDGVRHRERYAMLSWHSNQVHRVPNVRRNGVLAMLTARQIAANTTRGATPGLIDSGLGDSGGRIFHPVLRRSGGVRWRRRGKSVSVDSEDEDEEWNSRKSGYMEESGDGVEESEDRESEHSDDRCVLKNEEPDLDDGLVRDPDAQDGHDETSDSKASTSVSASIFSRPTRSAYTIECKQELANRSKAGIGMVIKGAQYVAYDKRGRGKTTPSLISIQPPKSEVSGNRGKTRKALFDGKQDPVSSLKKRICDGLPTVSHKGGQVAQSSGVRCDSTHTQLSGRSPPSSERDKKLPEHPKMARQKAPTFNWNRIEHATPYNLDSYANFFDNTNLGASLVLESRSDCHSSGSPPFRGLGVDSRDDLSGRVAEPVLRQAPQKRKRNGLLSIQSDACIDRMPKSRYSIDNSTEPAMVVLRTVPSAERNRSRGKFTPDAEDDHVPTTKKLKMLTSSVINYHYPSVLPVWDRQHDDKPARINPAKEIDASKWFQNRNTFQEAPPLVVRDSLRAAEFKSHISSEQQEKSRRLPLMRFRQQVLAGLAFEWLD